MALQLSIRIRQIAVALVILVQVFAPVGVWAEEAITPDTPSSEGEVQSPPAEVVSESEPETTEATPGPQKPNGADANTYVYNEETGLWENEHYTWDPVTKQTKPKVAPDYSYNPTTGQWDTTEWYYSPEQGKYIPNTISTVVAPAAAANSGPASLNTISSTGRSSNNTITNGATTTGVFDLFFDATISNKIGQLSRSGHASVQGNTTAGNATTGDATALANVLSMIQSNWGGLGGEDMAMFLANIDGDVVGDLYVDPSALTRSGGNTDLDVTVASDTAIYNDIDVDVASGNALVSNNTKAGNATSGKAQAVVNLLNLINSAITSNKSFIGVLNINGNLNGDILLPPSMLSAIIAATGPGSNNQITGGGNTVVDATVVDNKSINNDINANAATGSANVSNNTTAGSAKSGKADTNVVLLNFTGKRVVAKNAMLVFVNVMGSWVGLILDAPAGTNAVAATGPDSNNTITSTSNLTVETDVNKNSLIDNDIDVSARSGDAEVSGNTTGGGATTGDASVGVNVLNMIDSEFEVSDWFGVLFINVFGSWVGSFGVNTSAGNQPSSLTNEVPSSTAAVVPPIQNVGVFSFVPQVPDVNSTQTAPAQAITGGGSNSNSQVAGVATPTENGSGSTSVTAATSSGSALWMAALVTLTGVLMLGGERLISLIRSRQIA